MLAQSSGEADASGCRAIGSAAATPQEKAAARSASRAEGPQAARSSTAGDDQPCPAGTPRTTTPQERQAAAQQRRAEAAGAVRSGQIPSGETQHGAGIHARCSTLAAPAGGATAFVLEAAQSRDAEGAQTSGMQTHMHSPGAAPIHPALTAPALTAPALTAPGPLLAPLNRGTWRWWPTLGLVCWEQKTGPRLFRTDGDVPFEEWLDCVHPLDRSAVLERLRAAVALASSLPLRFRATGEDGTERWLEGEARGAGVADGPACVTVILFEGARRPSSDEAEERFRVAVESMIDPFGIYRAVRDERGTITDFEVVYVNDAACRASGLSCEEQVGRGLCEMLPGHRTSPLFAGYCEVVETGRPMRRDSHLHEDQWHGSRQARSFDVRATRFGDGVVVVWRDVTEAQRLLVQLREGEALLRLATSAAAIGIWSWELPSGRVFWSQGMYDVLGLHEPVRTARQFRARVHPEDAGPLWAAIDHAIATRSPLRHEFRVPQANSQDRWVLATGRVDYDDQGSASRLVGVAQDITEARAAQRAMEDSRRQKDEMMSIVSHELRNFLAPIRNAADLIAAAPAGSGAALRALDIVKRQVANLDRLVGDMLDLARMRTGKLEMEFRNADAGGVIARAVEAALPATQSLNQAVAVDVPDGPCMVRCDPVRLCQAVTNLLLNASKFTPPRGSITVQLQAAGGHVDIVVRDSGKGFEPARAEELFTLYAQGEPGSHGGLGIGLHLVRHILERHGGAASAHSDGVDMGSTFRLRLPQAGP